MRNLPRAAVAAGVLILFVVIAVTFWTCQNRGQRAAQAEQDASESEAFADAAEDAIGTINARVAEEAEFADVVDEITEEIENAEGADAAVNPAVRDAAIRGACRLRAYRDEPRCQVFVTDSP